MAKRPIFITGIGTGIGKTIVSAILVEKLKADYWKPVQSGDLDNSDTLLVKSLISNPVSRFHPEAYRLTQPFSPHKSAALDGIEIDPQKIIIPETDNQLIIEGAGGLMVPLNDRFLMIDLIQQLNAEVVLVSQNYLGSINHTLLSTEALKQRGIPIKAIIFNGDSDGWSEDVIRKQSVAQFINIPRIAVIDKSNLAIYAKTLTIQV
ncbi:dethiobiotin synthase [Mucilaginibacter sp. PPCGB 2223]|uniref:dethiobiotin synthase n=1 Tax=Mucilaginibacter sp. PPCGB 2223 TaxID=1886027 RepID=UPI0008254D78|nr:dethiobiotin synthase [Mucilaginibacter sp. PPCGB 2223]OCX53838.1 dethiobiotin synthase [Mucilaginibacter sp. PPCGB 2223]